MFRKFWACTLDNNLMRQHLARCKPSSLKVFALWQFILELISLDLRLMI